MVCLSINSFIYNDDSVFGSAFLYFKRLVSKNDRQFKRAWNHTIAGRK